MLTSVLAIIAPFAAAWGVAVDPLVRRKRSASAGTSTPSVEFIRVAPLDALPADGTPRLFVLTADENDAWTRVKNQRIGTAFLARNDSGGAPHVTALSSICPHLGCAVNFNAAEKEFVCPCHEASFAMDGARVSGPSKRGLDELAVELRPAANDSTDVYVSYVRFRPGIEERTSIS